MKFAIVIAASFGSLLTACTGGTSGPSSEGHARVTFDDAGKCELSSYLEQGSLFEREPKSADVRVVDTGGAAAMSGHYLRIAGSGSGFVMTHPADGGFCGVSFDYRTNEALAAQVVLENEGGGVRRARLPVGGDHFVLHAPDSRHSVRFSLNQTQGTRAVETFIDNMTVYIPDASGSCVPASDEPR